MGPQQQLLNRIVCFCQKDERVVALVLIGSQARTEKPADEYSDLDLLMVTTTPDHFVTSDEWLMEIGQYHICFTEPTIVGQIEKRALFDDGLDVDFVIIPAGHVKKVLQSEALTGVLSKGYRVLVNKSDLVMPAKEDSISSGFAAPTQQIFSNMVNDFWYHTIWTVKKLLRGELWAAKFCVDGYMKWKLLWMIEQYEHAKYGPRYDTWYGGRFIDRWAEPDIKDRLAHTFSNYNQTDMVSALHETMRLYRYLATEVSRAYGFEYPTHADEYACNWINDKLSRHQGI